MMKVSIFLVFLWGNFAIFAQQNSLQFSINHCALSVKDVHKSADFYKNVLQLEEITNRTETQGIRWFSLGEGKELHLISTIKDSYLINKAIHFALTTPKFDIFINRLDSLKVPFSDWAGVSRKISVRPDGIRQVFFQDVDGFWIEVNSVAKQK